MIPNHYVKDGCFTKHPFKNGCLGYQAVHYKNPPLCRSPRFVSEAPSAANRWSTCRFPGAVSTACPKTTASSSRNLLGPLGELPKNHYPSRQIPKIHQKLNGTLPTDPEQSCDRAIRFSGFFRVHSGTVLLNLLEISWIKLS